MPNILAFLKYISLFLGGEWLLSRLLPFDWFRACRIVGLGLKGGSAIDPPKMTMGWACVASYTALPLLVLALFAWDVTTRKARTAR